MRDTRKKARGTAPSREDETAGRDCLDGTKLIACCATQPGRHGYRCPVTTAHGGTAVDADGCVREIAVGLHGRIAELTADIQRCLEDEIPELGLDALTMELLGDSIGGNVDTMLHALRYDLDVQRVEAPTAAMEYARRLAQRG